MAALPKGASISSAASQTLLEIGFAEWAKTQTDHKDFKALSLAQNNDAELRRQGLSADVFISSVCALSEEGEFTVADLTGSRTGGFLAAKSLLLVLGSNKIVPNHAALSERVYKCCLPLESARVRDAYKIPASSITNTVTLSNKSPFDPQPRLTVVLIKESAGF